jgi:serine/threonine protein kinase
MPAPCSRPVQVIAHGMDEEELPTYNEKVDVWSVGALTFEAVTGFQPFLADGAADMAALIAARLAARDPDSGLPQFIARAPGLSPECRDFMARCFEAAPEARPGAAELLAHPWLSQQSMPLSAPLLGYEARSSHASASCSSSTFSASSACPSSAAVSGPISNISVSPPLFHEVVSSLSLPWLLDIS